MATIRVSSSTSRSAPGIGSGRLRPESSGLLLCACDLEPRPPEDAHTDEAIREFVCPLSLVRDVHLVEFGVELWCGSQFGDAAE